MSNNNPVFSKIVGNARVGRGPVMQHAAGTIAPAWQVAMAPTTFVTTPNKVINDINWRVTT